jgi:hypothetical protein
VKLRNFFVEAMKITPLNGSIFFKDSIPFFTGTVVGAPSTCTGITYYSSIQVCTGISIRVPIDRHDMTVTHYPRYCIYMIYIS